MDGRIRTAARDLKSLLLPSFLLARWQDSDIHSPFTNFLSRASDAPSELEQRSRCSPIKTFRVQPNSFASYLTSDE